MRYRTARPLEQYEENAYITRAKSLKGDKQ